MADLIKKYGIKVDPRYRQCNKESLVTFVVYIVFGILSSVIIYFLGVKKQPSEYGIIWGLPDWLFYGIILMEILFLIAVFLVVKYVYRELPFEKQE